MPGAILKPMHDDVIGVCSYHKKTAMASSAKINSGFMGCDIPSVLCMEETIPVIARQPWGAAAI
jgi:hypothetical protein